MRERHAVSFARAVLWLRVRDLSQERIVDATEGDGSEVEDIFCGG